MITERRRLRKIVVALIFTTLIWVFADLALDEELTVSNLKLSVAKSVNPALWVTFSGPVSLCRWKRSFSKGPPQKSPSYDSALTPGDLFASSISTRNRRKMTDPRRPSV